jgi:hypothetical protein
MLSVLVALSLEIKQMYLVKSVSLTQQAIKTLARKT